MFPSAFSPKTLEPQELDMHGACSERVQKNQVESSPYFRAADLPSVSDPYSKTLPLITSFFK